MSGTLVRIQVPSCSRQQREHVEKWLMKNATNPFPSPSKKAEMAATLSMAEFRLSHLVYNTRKRMFPELCKPKNKKAQKAEIEPEAYSAFPLRAARQHLHLPPPDCGQPVAVHFNTDDKVTEEDANEFANSCLA